MLLRKIKKLKFWKVFFEKVVKGKNTQDTTSLLRGDALVKYLEKYLETNKKNVIENNTVEIDRMVYDS